MASSYKQPEHKKRCKKCKYSVEMPAVQRGWGKMCACYYIAIKHERRGCPAENCDKFEPKGKGRRPVSPDW